MNLEKLLSYILLHIPILFVISPKLFATRRRYAVFINRPFAHCSDKINDKDLIGLIVNAVLNIIIYCSSIFSVVV